MQVQVITVSRMQGVGKQSKLPYNFLRVGGVVQTTKGHELCEFMLDGDHPEPKPMTTYNMGVEVYPDREKKLAFKVASLTLPGAPK